MATKKSGNKNIKIIAATSMVIFSLFASFSAAFAWFSSVNTIDNSTTGFGVNYDESTITATSVYCVKYDGIDGGVATKVTEENYSLVMSEYDYIFQDKNVNTPLFLRIVIEGFNKAKDLTVVVPDDSDNDNFWVMVTRNGDCFDVTIVNTTGNDVTIYILLVDNDDDPDNDDYPYTYTFKYNTGSKSTEHSSSGVWVGASGGTVLAPPEPAP